MDDLISRQAAIDAILEMNTEHRVSWLDCAIDTLDTLPSVQPDVIKCKDCKHKGTKNCVANVWAAIFGVTVKDDFYCGLAERRTDD